MNRFIIEITKYSCVGLLLYIAGVIVCGEFIYGSAYNNLVYADGTNDFVHYKLEELESRKEYDLLFIGSSHCYRTFDNRIFSKKGYSSFNLGSSSQTHIQSNWLLQDYVDQINPKLVVYEVYPMMFSVDGVESTLDLLNNEYNDDRILSFLWNNGNIEILNSLIFRWYRINVWGEYRTYRKVANGNEYINGGYVERIVTEAQPSKSLDTMFIEVRENQLQAFRDNVELLNNKEIPFILVEAPTTRMFNTHIVGADNVREKIKEYGEYIDFNSLRFLNDEVDFADYDHLNQKGVELFIPHFISELESTEAFKSSDIELDLGLL